jgi:hypothetical protein
MRVKGLSAIATIAVLITHNSLAQDKIYLASSTRQGKITAISAATVTYRPTLEKSQLVNIPVSNVVLLINDQGSWLIPSQLNFEEENTRQSVNNFLTQDRPAYSEDRIYCIDGLRMDGKILDEDDKSFTAVVNNVTKQIPKSAVIAVLYRNGRHLILGTINDARDALVKAQPVTVKSPAMPVVQTQTHTAIMAGITSQTTTAEPPTFESMAGNVSKADFETKTMQKTSQFSAYLKLLCDKSRPQNEMNKAIEMAIGLFVNEDARVETSSVTSATTKSSKIRNYLREVKMLNYDKIEIEWTNVQYVTDVRLDENNNWVGSVTFEQTFSGYRDGKLIYKDITTKKAEVVMKAYTKNVEGQRVSNWEVLLSNIGVFCTKAVNF